MARAARRGADPRLLRPLGAGRRLGRLGDPDDGGPEGRRLRRQRVEDVHHERRPGIVDRLLRLDRPLEGAQGPLRVRDPDGRRGRHDREAPRQDGPARDRHVRRRVPGRRRARGEPARRRGRRLQDRDADPRLHAPGNRRRGRRRRAGRLRARRRLREGARPVRDADRDEPGHLVPRRGHGHRDRGRPPAHVAGRVDDRPGLRAQGDEVLVVREAVRRGHRDEGHHRRGPGLRRLRLHQGVPGREAHARREAVPDLRGDLADPAARDREGDLPLPATVPQERIRRSIPASAGQS